MKKTGNYHECINLLDTLRLENNGQRYEAFCHAPSCRSEAQ